MARASVSVGRLLLLLGVGFALTSCDDPEGRSAACEQVACGQGACAVVDGVAKCQCDVGFHDEGGSCVADVDPLCNPNPCQTANKTVCSAMGGIAVCSCALGFEPDGEGCKLTLPAECKVQHPGDDFEPDECAQLARDIGVGGAQHELHSLDPFEDQDWFRIEGKAGTLYRVRAFGLAAALLQLDVFGLDGVTPIATENRGLTEIELVVKARVDGPLFIRALPHAGSLAGQYTISIEEAGADDHPDEPMTARPVTLGLPLTGALQFYADTEVFKLQAEEGHSYKFDLRWVLPGAGPLRAELIGPDQVTVIRQLDADAPTLVTRVSAPGEYYVRFSEPSSLLRGDWTAIGEDLGVDDHSDSIFEATPISFQAQVPGAHFAPATGLPGVPASSGNSASIDRRGDVDAFSFDVAAGHIRSFTCLPSPELVECHITLYDEAGKVLATKSGKREVWLGYEFETAGKYIVAVSSLEWETGPFTYRLEDLGVDDHGDVPAAATQLAAVGGLNARFELPDDRDVMALPFEAGHGYRVTCGPREAQTSASTCAIRLLDGAGTLLAESVKGVLEIEPPATGQVFVELAPDSGFGPYQFLVEDVGLDDYGDDVPSATPVTPGLVARPGLIELTTDVDVMSFTAQPGGLFKLGCRSAVGGLAGCEVELLDSTGALVGSSARGETVYRKLDAAGTYHLRVKPTPIASGSYEWELEDLGFDDHGDKISQATVVKADSQGTANIEIPGDRDVLRFETKARRVYRATCKADGFAVAPTTSECRMLLRDAKNNDEPAYEDPLDKDYWFKSEKGGPLFLLLSTSSKAMGGFSWEIEDKGSDDYGDEPDDSTPLPVGLTFTEGELEMPGDKDFFKVELVWGFRYRVRGTGPVKATLYDKDGVTVLESGDLPFSFTSRTNGTTYLEVKGEGRDRGDYTISVQP